MNKIMSKERAIEILEDLKQEAKVDEPELTYTDQEIIQALDIAIECIEHEEKCNKAINDSTKAIAEMERLCAKCQVDNEWVDVRDRLPSDKEQVLCYGEKCDGYGGVSKEYKICTYDKKADELFGRKFHTEKYFFVIAWKPLPQPYERKE